MTRMWMVEPKILCKKHLMGEHVEHHMVVGVLKKKYSLDGFIKNNLLEITSLKERHDSLVEEMLRRGYNHKTELREEDYDTSYLEDRIKNYKINKSSALEDLLNRCEECKGNYEKFYNKEI